MDKLKIAVAYNGFVCGYYAVNRKCPYSRLFSSVLHEIWQDNYTRGFNNHNGGEFKVTAIMDMLNLFVNEPPY